jgi:hypothetical protein
MDAARAWRHHREWCGICQPVSVASRASSRGAIARYVPACGIRTKWSAGLQPLLKPERQLVQSDLQRWPIRSPAETRASRIAAVYTSPLPTGAAAGVVRAASGA